MKIILKFGGTSVLHCSKEIIKIVRECNKKYEKIIIIFSAIGGITNKLLNLLDSKVLFEKKLEEIEQIHRNYISKNIENKDVINLLNQILHDFIKDIRKNVKEYFNMQINRDDNLKFYSKYCDIISSYGELISVSIQNTIFQENGLESKIVKDNLIITDSNFTNAFPDFNLTRVSMEKYLIPCISNNNIILVRGFVGTDKNKEITTLGRSGSDFSATILAKYIKPEEVRIYTDVNGILTADPRKVKQAYNIKKLSFREMGEMAFFGAKVFHSKTFIPLEEKEIDIKVLNTFDLKNEGTTIKKSINPLTIQCKKFNSINSISDNILITIQGKGMQGTPGISAKLFTCLYKNNINVTFITQASSEQTICFTIYEKNKNIVNNELSKTFEEEIKKGIIKNIKSSEDISIITVIGTQMIDKPGFAGLIFSHLGKNNINIIAISQGSSEISISFIVEKKKELETLKILHKMIE